MSARSDLAAAIETATTGVQVYGYLTDIAALPAAVIERTETIPKTTGGPNNLEHTMIVHLIVSRAQVSYAEDKLEDMFMDILEGLPHFARFESFSGPEQTTVNNVEAITAQLTLITKE